MDARAPRPARPLRWVFLALESGNDGASLERESDAIRGIVQDAIAAHFGAAFSVDDYFSFQGNVEWHSATNLLSNPANRPETIDVVVFAGHATREGFRFGESSTQVNLSVLASLLADLQNLKLLILNCCNTEEIARAVLSERLPELPKLVVLSWSTEVDMEGAMVFNMAFCREFLGRLGRQSIEELGRGMDNVYRAAFQSAIIDSMAERCIIGEPDNGGYNDMVTIGEPVLLPYVSSEASYFHGMITKYKVAEAGIELSKRLKSIVQFGYMRENDPDKIVTTLFTFGEFLAWLHLMRREDPEYFRSHVSLVEVAFSGEFVHLRDSKRRVDGADGPLGTNLLEPMNDGTVGDFATTVYPGCLSLYSTDMLAIAEVMLETFESRTTVKSYSNFRKAYELGQLWRQGLINSRECGGREVTAEELDEARDLVDAFATLEEDLTLLTLGPLESRLKVAGPPESWAGRMVRLLFGAHELANLPLVRLRPPADNPLYVRLPSGKSVLSRDCNMYRRIAWIHDSVIGLVATLDLSFNELRRENLFSGFSALDAQLYGDALRKSRTTRWLRTFAAIGAGLVVASWMSPSVRHSAVSSLRRLW